MRDENKVRFVVKWTSVSPALVIKMSLKELKSLRTRRNGDVWLGDDLMVARNVKTAAQIGARGAWRKQTFYPYVYGMLEWLAHQISTRAGCNVLKDGVEVDVEAVLTTDGLTDECWRACVLPAGEGDRRRDASRRADVADMDVMMAAIKRRQAATPAEHATPGVQGPVTPEVAAVTRALFHS
jgi:hypothetical protein